MKFKKIAALALALVMAFSLTGCLGNIYTKVMTVDGEDIGSGLYLMMQMRAYSAAESQYEAEYAEANDGEAPGSDYDILKQKIEGVSATAWIRAKTEEMARRYVAVQRLAREYGVTLSEDEWTSIETSISYYDYLEEIYIANGVGKESFSYYTENSYLDEALFAHMYGEDGPLSPDKAEMQERWGEIRVHLRYLSLPMTYSSLAEDYEEKDPDVIEALAKGYAESMLAALKSGTSLEELAATEYADLYADTGRDFDEDTEYVYTSYFDPTTYDEDFEAELFSANVGDVGLYQGEANWLLYEVIELFEDDAEFEEVRTSILNNVYYEEYEAWLAETYNTYSVSKVLGAEWFYRPSKIN